MYIGPWQEYKLSKQRGNDRPRLPPKGGPSSINSQTPVPLDVMKQLEKALQNSLDPAAAQAAVQAMNQVLRSQMQLGEESDYQSFPSHTVNKTHGHHPTHHSINAQHSIDSLSTHMAQQRQQRGSGHEKSSHHNSHGQRADSPRRNVLLYPTDQFSSERDRHFVPMMILSARDNYNHQQHQPSPLSVRSSQSEPIQSLPSLIHITPAVSKQVIPQYNSLTSKNLAINHQRLMQQKEYDGGGRRDSYPDQTVNSAPKVPEPATVIAAKSGYDTTALVNFLRMERNQRARAEISKLTGWNVLHGGGGLAADVRTSLASDSSLSDSKPPKDKATVLREKRIAEVEQMKAMYLKGARDIGGLSSGVNSPRVNPLAAAVALETASQQPPIAVGATASSSLVSPIPSPRLVDIDHLSDEHLMMVSKYFQEQYAETYHHGEAAGIAMPKGSTGSDYASLPLEESNLRPSRSMTSMQPMSATISVPAVHRSMIFSDDDDGSSRATSHVASRAQLLSTGEEDADGSDVEKEELPGYGEDDPVPSTYEATNAHRVQSPSPEDTLILFSPPDTAQGKVHATGSLMEDLHSGNLDSLLSWTRGLDNFDLDNI